MTFRPYCLQLGTIDTMYLLMGWCLVATRAMPSWSQSTDTPPDPPTQVLVNYCCRSRKAEQCARSKASLFFLIPITVHREQTCPAHEAHSFRQHRHATLKLDEQRSGQALDETFLPSSTPPGLTRSRLALYGSWSSMKSSSICK